MDFRPLELWETKHPLPKPPRSLSLSFGFGAKCKHVEGGRRRRLLFCLKSNVSSEATRPPETTALRHKRSHRRPDSWSYFLAQLSCSPGKATSRAVEPAVDHLTSWRSPGARCSQPPLANELKNELLARPAVGRGGSSFEPLADTPLNKSATRERERVASGQLVGRQTLARSPIRRFRRRHRCQYFLFFLPKMKPFVGGPPSAADVQAIGQRWI